MKRIFLGILAAALIYELVAILNASSGDTISELVWTASQRPLLPFAVGVLCGHFFWQRSSV